MSLKEKLPILSQESANAKEQKRIQAQDKELEPVRSKIKELESQKFKINNVIGALELNESHGTGMGIKKHSEVIKQDAEKHTGVLIDLINNEDHQEYIKEHKLDTHEKLVDHFKNDEDATEVHDYLDAKKNEKGLEMSDSALQERLETLGINIEAENFTYELAENLLKEKLKPIEDELIQGKLKTPEGKVEIINSVGKELADDISAYISNNKSEDKPEFELASGYSLYSFNVGGRRGTYTPNSVEKLKSNYGADLAEEAIKKSYEIKIDQVSKQYNSSEHLSEEDQKRLDISKREKLNKINLTIDRELKRRELVEEIHRQDPEYKPNHEVEVEADQYDARDFKNRIAEFERQKKDARDLLAQLTKLETQLPQEKLVFDGEKVMIPSIAKQLEEVDNNSQANTDIYNKKMTEYNETGKNKPKREFGVIPDGENKWQAILNTLAEKSQKMVGITPDKVKKWQTSLDTLGQELKNLNDQSNELYKDYQKLKKNESASIMMPQSLSEKLTKKPESIEGAPNEIFNNLKAELNEIIKTELKIPESVSRLYNEYLILEKQNY